VENLPQDFDPRKYLEINPDVAASGIDPILHWTLFGKSEGRKYRKVTKFENSESKYPKLAIFLMCKNEGYMLEAWIKHHVTIVSPQHLFIYDNGSTDSLTIEILASAQAMGCIVERRFSTKEHFFGRGTIMVLKMLELDVFDDFDFYLLLDTDEFLAVDSIEQYEVSSDAIHSYLASVPRLGSPLKIVKGLISNPYHAGYFKKNQANKTFFRRETAKTLDEGYHWGQTIEGGTPFETAITLVDFHFMGLGEFKKRAEQKLEGRDGLDIEDRESLEKYESEKKLAYHSVQDMNIEPERYMENLLISDFTFNPSLLKSLKSSGAISSLEKVMSFGAP
jgi:hypothetical protein